MKSKAKHEQGFTIAQMVITLTIISIISTFGVLGIRKARAQFQLQSAARLFSTYVEKARLDAIRRHAAPGEESSIETFGPGTTDYAVTMDFGSGVETHTYTLEYGMTFNTIAKKVSFDWRGRIAEAWVFQVRSNYLQDNLPVDVSGSGDITIGEQRFPDQMIPEIEISQVTGDVAPDSIPPAPEEPPGPETDPDAPPDPNPPPVDGGSGGSGGGGNGGDSGNGNPNGNPHASPTPTPTPAPTPSGDPDTEPTPIPQCISTISPSTLSLSQSDLSKLSGTAVFTMVNATGERTLSATQAGGGNSVNIALSLQRIDGSGASIITVSTKNGAGNRGVFIVNVAASPGCGSGTQLTVSVSN